MEALLRLVSLGSAARNTVKIKVRQPLAEMKVQPADERDQRAVQRFSEQVCEELNIKKVAMHHGAVDSLVQFVIKPNLKSLGPKLGPKLKEVQDQLARMEPQEVAKAAKAGVSLEVPVGGEGFTLEAGDFTVHLQAHEGWTAVEDRGTIVLLDTRITDSLKREGLAREVVRSVQNLRKEANLQLEDRIELHLVTDSSLLQQAVDEHWSYIAAETLALKRATGSLGQGSAKTDVKIEGQSLHVELRKV
jgi:isoleucyl-tRNA synthetase